MLGSSIGLGHRPFTAGRGVRFPYRAPLIVITWQKSRIDHPLLDIRWHGAKSDTTVVRCCGTVSAGLLNRHYRYRRQVLTINGK